MHSRTTALLHNSRHTPAMGSVDSLPGYFSPPERVQLAPPQDPSVPLVRQMLIERIAPATRSERAHVTLRVVRLDGSLGAAIACPRASFVQWGEAHLGEEWLISHRVVGGVHEYVPAGTVSALRRMAA